MSDKKRPSTAMEWAGEHWFLTGFFIIPALITLPVALISAVRGPTAAEEELRRKNAEADARIAQLTKVL